MYQCYKCKKDCNQVYTEELPPKKGKSPEVVWVCTNCVNLTSVYGDSSSSTLD